MKYKYIIIFNAHNKLFVKKPKPPESAYQFMCRQYTRKKFESNIDFYKKYPFNEIEKGFYNFTDEDEIQTVNCYINNYIKEAL